MKKTFKLMVIMVSLFMAASCQKSISAFDESMTDARITFRVDLPEEIKTKAISDGYTADNLLYEVWYSDKGAFVLMEKAQTELTNCQATVDFDLVRGLEYTFIFWAQAEDAPYGTADLRKVQMNYGSTSDGNKENRDAFFGVKTMTISDTDSENTINLQLKRPFGQLNLLSSDLTPGLTVNGSKVSDIKVNTTSVVVTGVATDFNTLTGLGENTADVTFKANGPVDANNDSNIDTFTIESNVYSWIAMNYILVPAASNNKVNVTASFNLTVTDDKSTAVTVNPSPVVLTNVPIKQNYRTNVAGDLFTEGGAFNISVDPKYSLPDDNSVTVE